MEDYVQDQNIKTENMIRLYIWLKQFLSALNLTHKDFAIYIDNENKNLRKYLIGERRFTSDLALKFGHFFHTSPELWMKIQIKNEFLLLNEEKTNDIYSKYDYEKVLQLT